MALPKLFERIFWHNNTTPDINEDNLNSMSKAIDDIDNRVIMLGDDVIEYIPQIQHYLEQAEDLVEAMENLSKNPPYIGSNGNWYVWDTESDQYVDSGVDASITVQIADVTMLAPDATPYITNTGTNTDPIFHLYIPRGTGINSISKTGTSGLVDTYTITFSDGHTQTFTVTNGKTAYQSAVEGGYSGSESDFEEDLSNFGVWAENAEQAASDSEAYGAGTRNGTPVASTDPAYHNNASYYANEAAQSSSDAADSASDSEAYGAGTRNGTPVAGTDPAYHNNARYYSEQAAGQTLGGLSDVDINAGTLANNQILRYNADSQKWDNVDFPSGGMTVITVLPTQSGTLTYDGTEQAPTWSNYSANQLTIGGVISGINAGTYQATFTPKFGFCWDDYSIGPKTISWSISKAPGSVTVSTNSIILDPDHLSAQLIISAATGDITISSSDSTVATVSPLSILAPGGNVTISSVNNTTGTATINIQVAQTNNYNSITTTVAVDSQFMPPLVPWTTGTDDQIAKMVEAYYDGTCSLNDIKSVWSVGDARTITVSSMSASYAGEAHRSQSVEMVILDFDHDTLTTPINDRTKALITVETKNCLRDATVSDAGGNSNTENGYMNINDTNVGGWASCSRRQWCNNTFYNALPAKFKAMVKQAKHTTTKGNQQQATEQTDDYIFLPSESEIFGEIRYSRDPEGTQYKYYETSANRHKLPNWDSFSISARWWERSPDGDATQFCYVSTAGTFDHGTASLNRGLAPACCI